MEKTKNNWFVLKKYGWGWTPSTWQGWSVSAVFFVILLFTIWFLLASYPEDSVPISNLILFFVIFVADVIALIVIAYEKGPKPRWRWGEDNENNDR